MVKASVVCTEDGWNVLQSVLCVIVSEACSVHTQPNITLHTLRPHPSRYTSCRTHATSPLGWAAAWPMPVVACVQSDVCRCKDKSPYSPGWSGFMNSPCPQFPNKGEVKISVWGFFSPYDDSNCWEWPCLTGGKKVFWSTSMFDSWPCSYWPSCRPCQHSPRYSYNLQQLLVLSCSHVHPNNCLRWVDHEYLSRCTCLFCPSTPQLSSHPWSLHEYHPVWVSVSCVLGPLAFLVYLVSQQ